MLRISPLFLSLCLLGRTAHAALDDALTEGDVHLVQVAGRTLSVRSHDGIDEYAHAGRVVAIKWHRRLAPPLMALLGPHRGEYEVAMRDRRRIGHGVLSLRTLRLAVQAHARPRAYRGALWLPAKLPSGVSIDALP